MVSPFRNALTEKYLKEQSTLLRWEKTLRFLNSNSGLSRGLDLGDRTPLTNELEVLFNCPFDNTTIDLVLFVELTGVSIQSFLV